MGQFFLENKIIHQILILRLKYKPYEWKVKFSIFFSQGLPDRLLRSEERSSKHSLNFKKALFDELQFPDLL